MDWPRLYDEHLRRNIGRYVAQSFMAAVAILIISVSVQVLMGGYLVASLGATTFIIFAMPSSRPARTRSLLGGYLIGTAWGVGLALVSGLLVPGPSASLPALYLLGALSVGASLFTMVATNCEHPPAAGLALGYVLSPWSAETPIVVMVAIGMLALVHHLMRKILVDLT